MDAWRIQGKCVDSDLSFFPSEPTYGRPPRGETKRISNTQLLEQKAARVCNGDDDGIVCPSRDECLASALSESSIWGVWGGKTPDELRRLRRSQRRRAC